MLISLGVTSSSHWLCRTFQPRKANCLGCLKSLPRASESHPKDIHCPAPCFQAGNVFHYASTSFSSVTYVWALLTSQRLVILSHCVGYSSATLTVLWKTHFRYMQTIPPTPDEEEQLSFADSLLHKLHFRTSQGNYSTFQGSKMIKSLREIDFLRYFTIFYDNLR